MGRHQADPVEPRKITDSFPVLKVFLKKPPEELADGETKRTGVWQVSLILGIVLAAAVGLVWGLIAATGDGVPAGPVAVVHDSPRAPQPAPETTVTKTSKGKTVLVPTPVAGPTVYVTQPPKIVYKDRAMPGPTITKTAKPAPAKTIKVTVTPEPEVINVCYRVNRLGEILGEIDCP